MDTLEERVTRIEERMATKDDIHRLDVDVRRVETKIAELESRITWRLVTLYALITVTTAGLLSLFQFLH